MTNDERWHIFIEELRVYVMEHHLFPDKHTRLSHKIKYTRKKIKQYDIDFNSIYAGIEESRTQCQTKLALMEMFKWG